ncbi:MAG TPA: hypothetical protein VE871_08010 [Longimicrobium sp.]|nr:hypothetical protein [Longimicrobium sp.]
MSGYKARAGDAPSTLLSYVMLTSPDPLQASAANAILTLVVSNPGGQTVTATSLVVTLPVGTNAKDLTADATGVQTQPAAGWEAVNAAGTITLTPTGTGEIGAHGLTFVFASIGVNAQVGLCTVTILETASSGGRTAQGRTASLPIPKFPAQFQVGDLQADPLSVASGGSTTLMWAGTGTQATYTLQYQPADEGDPVSVAVGNTGPYTVPDLTRAGQVTFTLIVQVTVPGLDTPLVVQRQASVSMETLSIQFTAQPPTVGVDGLARLQWTANNAVSCTLDPGGPVATSGVSYVVLPQTGVFTLTARDAAGNTREAQCTVTVDPTIVWTLPQIGVFGGEGQPGAPYGTFLLNGAPFGNGGPGGNGGPAILSSTLPRPGDDRTRVVRIVVIGGQGGVGGDSMNMNYVVPPNTPIPAGGVGGNGGDAVIDVRFDPDGPPTQYTVSAVAGQGGQGGLGYGMGSGSRAPSGASGTVSVTFQDL